MAFLKNGDYRVKLPSGHSVTFGIRNGQIRKISRMLVSETEFRAALKEAKKFLLSKTWSATEVLTREPVVITDQMRVEAAGRDWYHRCRHSDF